MKVSQKGSDAGYIELVIGGDEEKPKKPKYNEYEIESACRTILEAEAIKADKEKMPYVKDYMEKHQEALTKALKEQKSVKPKSVSDLREAANNASDETVECCD